MKLVCQFHTWQALHVGVASLLAMLSRSLTRFRLPVIWQFNDAASALLVQTAGQVDRGSSSLPAGHKDSDLRDVVCNIRLSRLRDITLRRDVSLYDAGKALKLTDVFKVQLCLLFKKIWMGFYFY